MESKKSRKACDLCYRKKIKCDGNKPRCMHCLVYDSECTYTAASRKRKRARASVRGVVSDDRVDAPLHSQIESLKVQLRDALEDNAKLRAMGLNNFEGSADAVATPGQSVQLPPEDIVYPLLDAYLSAFNCFLPLFDGRVLSKTVNDFYRYPTHRPPTAWACIHIIMALALSQSGPAEDHAMNVADCLDKAQSVLSDVLVGDVELAKIQVILGLVLLFLGTRDVRPAAVLIAVALRLAHVLGIHRREGYEGITLSERVQRNRVFWLAYILDREISMRARQPPVQHDIDMDLDFPPETPDEDGAGFISMSGIYNASFNFFRARVQLAQIQGQIYDCTFSVRAQHMEPVDATKRARYLQQSLYNWKSMIPLEFSVAVLSQSSKGVLSRHFCFLYCTLVSCLGQLCRITSMELHWIKKLLSYARDISRGNLAMKPILPQGWDNLVVECRSMLTLFMSVQQKDSAFIWMNACAFASGLLCLSANSMLSAGDRHRSYDRGLELEVADFIGQLYQQTNHQTLGKVQAAYLELDRHAVMLAEMPSGLSKTSQIQYV